MSHWEGRWLSILFPFREWSLQTVMDVKVWGRVKLFPSFSKYLEGYYVYLKYRVLAALNLFPWCPSIPIWHIEVFLWLANQGIIKVFLYHLDVLPWKESKNWVKIGECHSRVTELVELRWRSRRLGEFEVEAVITISCIEHIGQNKDRSRGRGT